ncbi:MAG: SDR family oxidoreductase [Actinobacteria bacterium]|nr:SDR family oxidoreductase [Actinomycetota bacterium]
MDVRDRIVVVTGGASGIGAALARRFAEEGAAHVVVADLDEGNAEAVASEIGGSSARVDVSDGGQVAAFVDHVLARHGGIDLYCSNAGVAVGGGPEAPDDGWQRSWDVNVMGHVHAARALLPHWLERGEGYLLGTVSAAGLLNHIYAMPYGATKAAALSAMEWLAMAYGDRGVKVSALCPMGVRTPMLAGDPTGMLDPEAISPEEVADAVVAGLGDESFLILPHPKVATYSERRGADHDRWLHGMRRLRRQIDEALAAAGEGA